MDGMERSGMASAVTAPGAMTESGALGLARGLGWFSIALGAIELLTPSGLTRRIGLRGSEALVRSYGLREIGTGIGILAAEDPTPWIWGRVAGDALDMTTAATGLAGPKKLATLFALVSLAAVGVVDLLCADGLSRAGVSGARGD